VIVYNVSVGGIKMKINEVAKLVGVSRRTLHYYDEINLLKPSGKLENGYRIYSTKDIDTLQQIMLYKTMGMSLEEIKEIITSKDFNLLKVLYKHKHAIQKRITQFNEMLRTVDKTIGYLKGEHEMSNQEKFKGFDFNSNPYEDEARALYGDEKVDASNKKVKGLDEKTKQAFGEVFTNLANIRHLDPKSDIAQAEIKKWFDLLNTISTFNKEAFKNLGELYIMDERFTKNIDQYGEGLARFMRDAMAYFAR
jgi:DNA-binding transcriptional MerR regulator